MATNFPGVDEYINCGSGATLDDIDVKSLTCWMYVDQNTGAGAFDLVTKLGAWYSTIYGATASPANVVMYSHVWTGGWGYWGCPKPSNLAWHHIVIIYNRGATTNDPLMYVDGVSQTVTEYATPSGTVSSDAAADLKIGGGGGGYYDGKMEDVRVFNRILTAQEIAILAGGYRGPLGGEVGRWMLDTANAITHWDGANLTVNTNYIPDLSGNANTGNQTGTPLGIGSTCPRVGGIID